VAQAVLAEAQDAVVPLLPHLDTLQWLMIAPAWIRGAATLTPNRLASSAFGAITFNGIPVRE
jgi:hypothetical protein